MLCQGPFHYTTNKLILPDNCSCAVLLPALKSLCALKVFKKLGKRVTVLIPTSKCKLLFPGVTKLLVAGQNLAVIKMLCISSPVAFQLLDQPQTLKFHHFFYKFTLPEFGIFMMTTSVFHIFGVH